MKDIKKNDKIKQNEEQQQQQNNDDLQGEPDLEEE